VAEGFKVGQLDPESVGVGVVFIFDSMGPKTLMPERLMRTATSTTIKNAPNRIPNIFTPDRSPPTRCRKAS